MTENFNPIYPNANREPWNKGKLIGPKPPLRPKHVWAIRTKLQLERDTRDLALFNLAIDSKLRGCDVVAVRVEDVAPRGFALDRATVRQKKTGRPVKFELTEQSREAIDAYLRQTGSTNCCCGSKVRKAGLDQRPNAPHEQRSAPERDWICLT